MPRRICPICSWSYLYWAASGTPTEDPIAQWRRGHAVIQRIPHLLLAYSFKTSYFITLTGTHIVLVVCVAISVMVHTIMRVRRMFVMTLAVLHAFLRSPAYLVVRTLFVLGNSKGSLVSFSQTKDSWKQRYPWVFQSQERRLDINHSGSTSL